MPRSLDDVPDRLILFDGVCELCCWWVRFVIERDASARFRFVAIQSTRGSALATRLAVDVASPETNVAIINGHAYFKSDAMILVLAGLPGWSWSRIFLLLPRRVRDWAYDRIARNRYRLFGRNESCLVPTSAIAARFVLDDPPGEQATPVRPQTHVCLRPRWGNSRHHRSRVLGRGCGPTTPQDYSE
jgi:predicted DCC family thiol-disulfide oxidoreductase YuxK